jgi:hypothetical protein
MRPAYWERLINQYRTSADASGVGKGIVMERILMSERGVRLSVTVISIALLVGPVRPLWRKRVIYVDQHDRPGRHQLVHCFSYPEERFKPPAGDEIG